MARAGLDDRATIGGPESETGPAGAVRTIAVAERLAGAGDRHPRGDGGGVGEALWFVVSSGEVGDAAEAEVPALLRAGELGGIPEGIDGCVDP